MTGPGVRQLIGWHRDLPQQEERARLLREVGSVLQQQFGGQAAQLVEAAGQSAVRLVQLLAAHCPGFRDHSVYKGHQVCSWGVATHQDSARLAVKLTGVAWRQHTPRIAPTPTHTCAPPTPQPTAHYLVGHRRKVFFYKRAQIFVGDLFGAFGGAGLGSFNDIQAITMFAGERGFVGVGCVQCVSRAWLCQPPHAADATLLTCRVLATTALQTTACPWCCGTCACCTTASTWPTRCVCGASE
jgi:hypothetical protein